MKRRNDNKCVRGRHCFYLDADMYIKKRNIISNFDYTVSSVNMKISESFMFLWNNGML